MPLVRQLGIAFAVAVLLGSPQAIGQTPLIKDGACPSGYYTSRAYCAPTPNARAAVAKSGSCPSGYFSSGNYCVASSAAAAPAVPKHGACPSGYRTSGAYCLRSR